MNDLDFHVGQLVIANRILANEGVVDAAYGHVGIRHPHHAEQYFLSWSRSPELVEGADLMAFTLGGNPVCDDSRASYLERFIHGAIYEARPNIHAPVWDIADTFGDHTNLLVTHMPQGRDLARCLSSDSVALMRGHGFTAAAPSLIEVVRSLYTCRATPEPSWPRCDWAARSRACCTARSRRTRRVTNPTRWKRGEHGNIGRKEQAAAIW
jgi:HCOMODA/2-hydroxy-3-carboxy-muconic semialdehyde decarboxylase